MILRLIEAAFIAGFALTATTGFGDGLAARSFVGKWSAAIDCPGGKIRFGLELSKPDAKWTAHLVNGSERIKVPRVEVRRNSVRILIDHYDSVVELTRTGDSSLQGTWKKRRGVNEFTTMQCRATRKAAKKSAEPNSQFCGRWAVDFESSTDPAVAQFESNGDRVSGTFLTTTGDYRFLDGQVSNGKLELSCFDGGHAFLFRAALQKNQKLTGDFWSSAHWHESWTATRNPEATLPDDFQQTRITRNSDFGKVAFPDLEGNLTKLTDPRFAGKIRIIYAFGSWCPNCHDAAKYLAELKKKYGEQGLSILGLAFEVTGDFERDAEQVRKYLARNGSEYPVLIAGLADKAEASKKLPFLDRLRSYPTTIFLDGNDKVIAVHTGFTGPATGDAYIRLRTRFEQIIEDTLEK